jgi:hypothetical protein
LARPSIEAASRGVPDKAGDSAINASLKRRPASLVPAPRARALAGRRHPRVRSNGHVMCQRIGRACCFSLAVSCRIVRRPLPPVRRNTTDRSIGNMAARGIDRSWRAEKKAAVRWILKTTWRLT